MRYDDETLKAIGYAVLGIKPEDRPCEQASTLGCSGDPHSETCKASARVDFRHGLLTLDELHAIDPEFPGFNS